MTLLIAAAAFNTGNNLIYILLAMMLAIVAVAVIGLGVNMRGLSVLAQARGPIYAGEAALIDITVNNAKRFLPTHSLCLTLPEVAQGEGVILRVGPMTSATGTIAATFNKRGLYPATAIAVESGFPFIFMFKSIKPAANGTLTVYPKLRALPEESPSDGRGDDSAQQRKGEGEDLYGIRKFQHGDDTRHVSWKSTAKSDTLMLREFAVDTDHAVTIVLDDLPPYDPEAFERVVSVAASLALKLLRTGPPVGLLTCTMHIPASTDNLYKILDALAIVQETENSTCMHEPGSIVGIKVAVLKSAESTMGGFASECEMITDASAV